MFFSFSHPGFFLYIRKTLKYHTMKIKLLILGLVATMFMTSFDVKPEPIKKEINNELLADYSDVMVYSTVTVTKGSNAATIQYSINGSAFQTMPASFTHDSNDMVTYTFSFPGNGQLYDNEATLIDDMSNQLYLVGGTDKMKKVYQVPSDKYGIKATGQARNYRLESQHSPAY